LPLAEALALPFAKTLLTALIKGESNGFDALPQDLVGAFFKEVLVGLDEQKLALRRIEGKLDLILDQDFDRDFQTARAAMEDATRTTSVADRETYLLEAWTRLRSAAEGTQNLLRKADALYAAAVVAMQRGRPEEAIARVQAAWDTSIESFLADFSRYKSPSVLSDPAGARLLRLISGGADPNADLRRDAADRCIVGARRADEASRLLAALGQWGHPVIINPLPKRSWAHLLDPPSQRREPMLSFFGGRDVAVPQGRGGLIYRTPQNGFPSVLSIALGASSEDLNSYRLELWPTIGDTVLRGVRYVDEQRLQRTGSHYSFPWPDQALGRVVVLGPPGMGQYVEAKFGSGFQSTPWNIYMRI